MLLLCLTSLGDFKSGVHAEMRSAKIICLFIVLS